MLLEPPVTTATLRAGAWYCFRMSIGPREEESIAASAAEFPDRMLDIPPEGYLGGEVIFAPFNVDTIAKIPKTVYAFNPMFFVCESFEQMDALLDSYLAPIAARN